MDVVKIRRVGNSNVISLPRSLERLGYTSGTSVVVDELDTGELRVVPAGKVHDLIRETGRRVVAEIFSCSEQQARHQLRDRGGLESALARPSMYAHYQGADLAMQAAVLAHGIAEGQFFVEGNKRTALAACLTFLRVNGHDIIAPQATRATWIIELSRGRAVEARLAKQLRSALDPPL